ncbi:MAG: hypothetical protein ACLTS1_12840 [Coprococcus sp.]
MNEQSEIRNLKGIGAKTEELFHKMGIFTIGDLLRCYHLQSGYDVYEARAGKQEKLERRKDQHWWQV